MIPDNLPPGGFARIDSHQHFTPEFSPSLLYPILKRNRFDGTVSVVPSPSVEATRWLLGQAAEHEFVRGVVGWVDLGNPGAGQVLDEYQRHAKFRGVRWWFDGTLPQSLEEVARRGLTLDVASGFTGQIVDRFPDMRVVIDDVAAGQGSVPLEFAAHPNLYAKISGLITQAPTRWKVADFQPAVRATLAAFGVDRVMYGSDWPSYLPTGTWKEALAAFTQAIGAQTMETREHLLGATARRFYGLE
ncbi:MAG: amidohydrolase family protein [Candidatus Solibacter sp.]